MQRFVLHFVFVLLFALTQIGIVTHEISHFENTTTQSQHNKNAPIEHCEQCLGYAEAASGLVSHDFHFEAPPQQTHLFETPVVSFFHTAPAFQQARAPPAKTQFS